MNIEQYRAMKAEQESQKDQPEKDTDADAQTTQIQEQTTDKEAQDKGNNQDSTQQSESTPSKITIDGIGEVTLDELKEWKQGYLRQSDYTKKTQELSNQKKEVQEALNVYNYLRANPQVAQAMFSQEGASIPQDVAKVADPNAQKVDKLEQQLYDMMLQKEISDLQQKYSDFEVLDVLDIAYNRNINNLEDAYHLSKSLKGESTNQQTSSIAQNNSIDVDALKKQLRDELKRELASERDTSSIISSRDATAPSKSQEIELSPQEDAVRQKMRISKEEWIKWKKNK